MNHRAYHNLSHPLAPLSPDATLWRHLICLAFCLTVAVATLSAGIGPHETVVAVNADSWVSRTVGNQYARLRGIPFSNIVVIDNLGIQDGMGVEEFRESILKPLLASVDKRGINQRLSCVVYAPDFPTWIDISADLKNRTVPRITGSMASLTGLTYLYQDVLARNPDYVDLSVNWYARRRRQHYSSTIRWDDEAQEAYKEVEAFFLEKRRRKKNADGQDYKRWVAEQWQQVRDTLFDLTETHPHHPLLTYNLACALAQTGREEEAMATLERATALGFDDYRHIQADEDLAPLHNNAAFQALMTKLQETPPDMPPALPFSGRTGWTPTGRPVTPYKGARFLLCTMLGVTAGRGNSPLEIMEAQRRSVAADGSAPDGTVYFMQNQDVRSRSRAWAVEAAAAKVRENGVKAEVLNGVLPRNRDDVAGLFTGTASFNWDQSGSTILPGAICEHLTSYGAVFRENAGQTPLTEFIRQGAAGSSGTVAEPYAIQNKFPTAYIQAYYTAGFTLAESFYLSVSGPYQLLAVGDALCAPWATLPDVRIKGIQPGQHVAEETVSVSMETPGGGAGTGIQEVTWSVDGRARAVLQPDTPFVIPAGKLSRGWHFLACYAMVRDRSAPRASASVTFFTGGEPGEFDFVSAADRSVPWGETIRLIRNDAATGRVSLIWMGREVAVLEEGAATTGLSSQTLALGTVRLRPVILVANQQPLIGQPLDIEIEPPQPLSSLAPPGLAAVLQKGLNVTVAGLTMVHEGKTTGDWLEKLGTKKGDAVSIDAWFEVEEDALAEFQFNSNLPLDTAVSVDGTSQHVPDGNAWRSFPVSLAKGTHHLNIQTIGIDNPRLDIRFGVRGTQILDGERFRHK